MTEASTGLLNCALGDEVSAKAPFKEDAMKEFCSQLQSLFLTAASNRGWSFNLVETFLPYHDVTSIATKPETFNIALLRAGDQDIDAWAQKAIGGLLNSKKMPAHASAVSFKVRMSKSAHRIRAWLVMHVMTPSNQARRHEETQRAV